MPKGELICEGCGQYESECQCHEKEKRMTDKMTESEEDFQEWFRHLAVTYNYMFYHTHRSQHSPSGFPDNVLIRVEPKPRLIFAELKTDDLENSQPSFEQWAWLYCLQQIQGIEAYLFRCSDREEIGKVLR